MSSTSRLMCVGDVMIDVTATLAGPLAIGSDSPAAIRFGHGGSAANTAAWAALRNAELHDGESSSGQSSSGAVSRTFSDNSGWVRDAGPAARVQLVARVGTDFHGDQAEQALRAARVSASLQRDEHEPTGTCIVLVHADGERTMIPSAGANLRLSAQDPALAALGPQDLIHLSAYTLLRPTSHDAAMAIIQAATHTGAALSVDAASAAPLAAAGAERFLGWLPRTALLVANCDEAQTLTGFTEPARAAQALGQRFTRAVVKCGADGAVCIDRARLTRVPSTAVAALDTTGAGDAFAAGLLVALQRGAGLVQATEQGNLLGARAVALTGARP